MSTNQEKIKTETKENIISAYWALYTADIPGKITVKMITDKAGYNRGTFYAYFLDINDLHNQIEDELLPSEEDFKKLREATFSKNTRKIIEIFMQSDKESGKKVSFLLSPKGSLSFQHKLKAKLKELILKYANLDLKNSQPHIIDYKAEIVCSIFYETIRYWYDKGNKIFSEEEMTTSMLKIISDGILDYEISVEA
ncbi:Hypothetical protein ING2D1G_1476 [Peptoniphilus sp. ING2-D1G]|nr:Hypothetical protein ING2D1G_1476 [Peptoniphilus sp. ING2-D1G]